MHAEVREATDAIRTALEKAGFQVVKEVDSRREDEVILGVMTPGGEPMTVTVSLTE